MYNKHQRNAGASVRGPFMVIVLVMVIMMVAMSDRHGVMVVDGDGDADGDDWSRGRYGKADW